MEIILPDGTEQDICGYGSNKEYIDSDNVEINYYINDSRVRIRESSFDNNIRVKNTYNINS